MAVPPEQLAMRTTIAAMQATMVPMPIGESRSYMQILDGNNLCTSLFLLLCGILLFAIARSPSSLITNRILIIVAIGLTGFASISAVYFFPLPAIFTGLAAALCIIACTHLVEKNSN